MIPMEPGSLVMERMLRGIKQRAERLAAETQASTYGRLASKS